MTVSTQNDFDRFGAPEVLALAVPIADDIRERVLSAIGIASEFDTLPIRQYGLSTLTARGMVGTQGEHLAPTGAALAVSLLLADAHHGVVIMPEAESAGPGFMVLAGDQALLAVTRHPYGSFAFGVVGTGDPSAALDEVISQLFEAGDGSPITIASERFADGHARAFRLVKTPQGFAKHELESHVTGNEVNLEMTATEPLNDDQFMDLIDELLSRDDADANVDGNQEDQA